MCEPMPWLYFAFVQSVFAFVGRPSPAAAAAAAVPGANLPFTFAMPETPQQLENIVGKLSAEETGIALERIRKCHAPTLKEDNRKKTQTFLGLLLQRFEVLAGVTPLPVAHLDVVAARARLEKMSARLRRALRDNETGWPPARTLLLLSLFADLFPTTDKQHPVGLVPVESR
jgi:nucleolar protein 14